MVFGEVGKRDDASSKSLRVRFSAYELFGEMRNSTPEENELYRRMLEKKSESLEINIFAQELFSEADTKL